MKSDSQLQRDVSAELRWEPAVRAARLGVEVNAGVVTLAGQVESCSEKWHAERAAQRVSGVKALTTELKVHPGDMDRRADADIARAVEDVLAWSSSRPADAIHVMVEDGWVTLSGDVDGHYQRAAAARGVRTLLGVPGISDHIRIEPSLTPAAVKSDIEAALRRTSVGDTLKISVTMHGSDVTLSGTVRSWDERDTATNTAWRTPGVRNVVDMLTLTH